MTPEFNSQNTSLPKIYLLTYFRVEILFLPRNKFLKNRILSVWLNYYILSLTISCLPRNLPSKYTLPFYLGLYRRCPLHLGSLCAALHLSMQEGKSRYKAKKVKSIVVRLSLNILCNSGLIFKLSLFFSLNKFLLTTKKINIERDRHRENGKIILEYLKGKKNHIEQYQIYFLNLLYLHTKQCKDTWK